MPTATPWHYTHSHYSSEGRKQRELIQNDKDEIVAVIDYSLTEFGAAGKHIRDAGEANAALIVRAVNAHQALVEALKCALPIVESTASESSLGGELALRVKDRINAALKLAESN